MFRRRIEATAAPELLVDAICAGSVLRAWESDRLTGNANCTIAAALGCACSAISRRCMGSKRIFRYMTLLLPFETFTAHSYGRAAKSLRSGGRLRGGARDAGGERGEDKRSWTLRRGAAREIRMCRSSKKRCQSRSAALDGWRMALGIGFRKAAK